MIDVLVVDDHAVVRTGLERLVSSAGDMRVVGTAADGEEGVRLAAETRPDVVLMDLVMPRVDGSEATRRILEDRPETSVVVLTSFSDRERIVDALDAGAVGYLLKDTEPGDLLAGIRAAARGEAPLNPRAARELLAARAAARPMRQLSAREQEVLAALAEGLPNKLIARRLGSARRRSKRTSRACSSRSA